MCLQINQKTLFNIVIAFILISEGDLYVATVAQFTGADPLIYREPLRTEQFNWKHLNGNFFSLFVLYKVKQCFYFLHVCSLDIFKN